MLTEYDGKVFRVKIRGDKADIWKYIPVDGFPKATNSRGVTYYKKTVSIKDIGELFEVLFVVFGDGRRFTISSVNNNNIMVLCDSRKYAEEHGFSELERGVWIAEKSIDLFDKIQMKKLFEDTNEDTITDLNKQQFIDMWNKYEFEPSISYFFKNQTNH